MTHKLPLGALSRPGYRKEIIFSKYFYLWSFLEYLVSQTGEPFLFEVCLPFNCTADVHLTQTQSALCPVLLYSLSFSNVTSIPPAGRGQSPEWPMQVEWAGLKPLWWHLPLSQSPSEQHASEHSDLRKAACERELEKLCSLRSCEVKEYSWWVWCQKAGVTKFNVQHFWDSYFQIAWLVLTFLPIG